MAAVAGTFIWIGSNTPGDHNVGANWEIVAGAGVSGTDIPATGSTYIFNHQATSDLTTNISNLTFDTTAVYVTSGFKYSIGSSGTPFAHNSITDTYFEGSGPSCYLRTDAGMTRVVSNSTSASETALVLKADTATGLGRLVINSGKVTLDSSTLLPATGEIIISEPSGGTGSLAGKVESKLTIPAGISPTTGHKMYVRGGRLITSSSPDTLFVDGGEATLQGAAAITVALDARGGSTYWNSTGTITLATLRGSAKFIASQFSKNRTLTAMRMYDDSIADFTASYNITFPTAGNFKVYGKNPPKGVPGLNYTLTY